MIRNLLVEIASPAMIGGSNPQRCDDPPVLRPPSVRGQLRFWTRLLDRAIDPDPSSQQPSDEGTDLAGRLWGTTASGQRVRLLLSRWLRPARDRKKPEDATLVPSKKIKVPMIPPGDQVLLRFALPDPALLPALQAVVWTWLHLGAVGRRSRRGYGSLRWLPAKGDLLTGWPPLWPSHHLTGREVLEDYLRDGLARVRSELGVPDAKSPRVAEDGGRLRTLDQVFVGKVLPGQWEVVDPSVGRKHGSSQTLEELFHGRPWDSRGSDASQLGDTKDPSPLMWRVFPVHGAGHPAVLPVLTWLPSGYKGSATPRLDGASAPGGGDGLYGYLHDDLGFDRSLAGGALFQP